MFFQAKGYEKNKIKVALVKHWLGDNACSETRLDVGEW